MPSIGSMQATEQWGYRNLIIMFMGIDMLSILLSIVYFIGILYAEDIDGYAAAFGVIILFVVVLYSALMFLWKFLLLRFFKRFVQLQFWLSMTFGTIPITAMHICVIISKMK
jgi:hypothetical protein